MSCTAAHGRSRRVDPRVIGGRTAVPAYQSLEDSGIVGCLPSSRVGQYLWDFRSNFRP